MTRLLVLCTHNSARSQMGEGWLRKLCQDAGLEAEILSAGTEKTLVKPPAIEVMGEIGIDLMMRRRTSPCVPSYRRAPSRSSPTHQPKNSRNLHRKNRGSLKSCPGPGSGSFAAVCDSRDHKSAHLWNLLSFNCLLVPRCKYWRKILAAVFHASAARAIL